MAVLLGENDRDKRVGGGVSEFSPRELSTRGSGFTTERSKSFSWKPVWYTGWHTGVLASAASGVVVLFINIGLTIYAARDSEGERVEGVGTLYSGSCDKSKTIGLWLHLGINALSTLLLSASNYTQQCLAAPARSEIDAAHAKRRWMDIGVPSIRNLFRIKLERTLLWIFIGLTSIPLHLLYNSAVFNSVAGHDFVVTVVTNNHFEPGAYSNMTEALPGYFQMPHGSFGGPLYGYPDFPLFNGVLEGYNANPNSYEYLTPSECTKLYNNDYVSSHRNLFLITKQSSNTTHNNTILDMIQVGNLGISPSSWMCAYDMAGEPRIYIEPAFPCDPSVLTSNVTSGLPWRVKLTTGEEVEIGGCKSEKTAEMCRVQFMLEIMVVVICCNFVKVCCMVIVLVRYREPTLVTLGDAIDSFLRNPDPTTIGVCFADRRYIKREWRRDGWRAEPRRWKQKGVQRWWTSVSATRWITCNFFCLIIIIAAGVSLRLGMDYEGQYWSTDIKSMWSRGFGKVNSVAIVNVPFPTRTQSIIIANLPQAILSFLYLTYNSLFTCMLQGHEWSLFSHHHRALRVTSPRPGQRSTYWLQVPYTYAIPLMILSALLHWLTSQSLFLAEIQIWNPLGTDIPAVLSGVGFSSIAILFVLMLSVVALLASVGIGFKRFAAATTAVGSCSAAISAACHVWGEDSEEIAGKKVRLGDVGPERNQWVRHFTFSSEEGVGKPIFGQIYAGTGGILK